MKESLHMAVLALAITLPAVSVGAELCTIDAVPAANAPVELLLTGEGLPEGRYALSINFERACARFVAASGSNSPDGTTEHFFTVEISEGRLADCSDPRRIGRRGTTKLGRQRGRQREVLVSIPGRERCDIRGTVLMDSTEREDGSRGPS